MTQILFTVGQVAKICKVAPRTVSKWFDSGRLRGYRIPGSQDRRIPREYLIRFLKEHGMPLGELECSVEYPSPDGWFDAGLPPLNCRRVVMRFDDDGSRDCEGFYWAAEGAWYKSEGSKARRNAVHPVRWQEKPNA